MVDSLDNLQQVYSKWESRNPWNSSWKTQQQSQKSYQNSLSQGKEAWKKRFGNIGPPPTRRQRHSRTRNSHNSVPLVSLSNTNLCQFKLYPSIMPTVGRSRPFMGRCCSCMPNSKNDLYDERYKNSGVHNILFIESSNRDLISRNFKKLAFMLRLRINHCYPDVSMAVLTSPRLVEAIHKTVQEELGEKMSDMNLAAKKQKELKQKAKHRLNVMQALVSNKLLRDCSARASCYEVVLADIFSNNLQAYLQSNYSASIIEAPCTVIKSNVFLLAGWVLHHVLSWFLDTVLVHKGQIAMLNKAVMKGVPMLYLPTHRSHLDYILLTFVLANNNLQSPYVAAGDNLRIPLFGKLLRGLGGYFIRRKLDRGGKKDLVYRAMLHSYMEELLRANEHLEFFIEGGRTRSGKALYPKGGLLSVIVDCYNEGVFPDALVVPVSISYDRLLDGNFNTEQMGEEKVFESFLGTIRAMWRVIRSKYGNVRIDFAQPFSIKEYLQVSQGYQHQSCQSSDSSTPMSDTSQEEGVHPLKSRPRRGSTHSLYGTDIVVDDMRITIQGLAEHVVYNQVNSQAVMSTQLLAFLLLVKHREGAKFSTVISTFDWLKGEIVNRKHDLAFTGNSIDVVQHACTMLANVVKQQVQSSHDGSTELYLKPSLDIPHVFELSYYSNTVVSLFALESIVANAVFSLVDPDCWSNQGYDNVIHLSRTAIVHRSIQLCNLFKYEFLLKAPCQQYDTILSDALDEFLTSEILVVEEEDSPYRDTREKMWSSNLAKSLSCVDEDSDDDIEQDIYYELNQESVISMDKFWFLKSVIGPLLECYFICACNLVMLEPEDIPETQFIKTVHQSLKERAKFGTAQYNESCALDTLKNALRAFEQQHIIDLYSSPSGTKMTGLNKKYKNGDKLNEFIVQLETYRS